MHDLSYKYQVVPPHESDIDKDFLSGKVANLMGRTMVGSRSQRAKDLNMVVAPFLKFSKTGSMG